MDLTTRCPQCGTTFSASLEQLQLRKGYIRCINCAHIFDGYDAVVSPGGAPPPADVRTPPPRPPEPSEPSVSMPSVLRQRPADAAEPVHTITPLRSGQETRFTISGSPEPAPEGGRKPVFHVGGDGIRVRSDPVAGDSRAEPVSIAPATASAEGRARPQIYVEPRHDEARARPPEFLSERAGPSGVMRLLWRVLVLLGMVLLLGQLAYVYRVQIANNVPMLRPVLERACAPLDCNIPYSREIGQISIMSSSLRSGSGAVLGEGAAASARPEPAAGAQAEPAADAMLLQLTLRNTYDKPQEWPTLVLDLTDFSGALVVRKNLPPQSYLPLDVLQQPFQAGSEVTVSVPIVLNGLKINGYQLDKFFQ
ncbi:zinc-ribbon and DUF3426 domain-containing protein [Pusillimonas sp. SM2304]|uniref:zinc-ribbon and DUF3426 domain-containing protein n=1 Tax=Pusillimonas sp. SM2304 TaxID=3073241 RepID=UPI002875C207|nr:zinc-ribbon and DUF3426 domain-containing protein [Pusillimonas sp. SM2304]MDS1140365.1 zinc-ribbon and DUF3426 domain-containing protein [Pusillimonas sp. SM2304]